MTTAEYLQAVKDDFQDGELWIQRPGSPRPGMPHCLTVGLNSQPVWHGMYLRSAARQLIKQAIGRGPGHPLWVWNDAPGRTWAEVDAVLGAAIELAEREDSVPLEKTAPVLEKESALLTTDGWVT